MWFSGLREVDRRKLNALYNKFTSYIQKSRRKNTTGMQVEGKRKYDTDYSLMARNLLLF